MELWFSKKIVEWYQSNKRDLPWRNIKDPYKIWLSEVILQQTQVNQGLDYYRRFVAKYPKVNNLANASEDEILKLWQGLGYYSRARNLHSSAKLIATNYAGVFPNEYEQIKALKGVGNYTAAAIASFAFDLPHAVVDGNVYRVLSRVFGIKTPVDCSAAKKEFYTLAQDLLDKHNPANHNQAIMEFGSQFCKPVNPDCDRCILRDKCYAFEQKMVAELPVKSKKIKIRDRYFNYLIFMDNKGNILVNKRSDNDIWKGLYEFYLLETKKPIKPHTILNQINVKPILKSDFGIKYVSSQYKHVLSHQHLYSVFYVIRVFYNFNTKHKKVNLEDIKNLAFPRLIDKFLNGCDLKKML